LAIEEHGAGKQLLRFRSWPLVSWVALAIVGIFATLAGVAAAEHAWAASLLLAILAASIVGWSAQGCARAEAAWELAVEQLGTLQLDPRSVNKKQAGNEQATAATMKQTAG
jgi:hypothetical protein